MIYVGIDPGLKGGVAAVRVLHAGQLDPVWAIKLPYLATRVDVVTLYQHLGLADCSVAIEQQNLRPGQGSGRSLLSNYGRLLGTVELAQVPYREVTAPVWNKWAGIPPGLKSGKPKKEASFEAACRIFGARPLERLGLKPTDDGKVEALLIAGYLASHGVR